MSTKTILTTPDARKIHITPRDVDVLKTINDSRLIELRQLTSLHFNGSTLAQRRLSDLKSIGLVRRVLHRRPTKPEGRGRYSTYALYTLTQAGKEMIGAGAQDYRVPSGDNIEMHLRFIQVSIEARLHNIPWKYRHQLEEEYVKAYYVPLRGKIGNTLLYHARWTKHVSNIYEHYVTYCAVRGGHNAIVVADNRELLRTLREEYPGGNVRAILPEQMQVIPIVSSNPSYYLRILLNKQHKDIPFSHSSHAIDGNTIYAELVTGDIHTRQTLTKFLPERTHILVANEEDAICGSNVYSHKLQP
jgi:hypothetical protein